MNNKGLIEPVRITTAQRNALIMGPADTGVIFNITTARYEGWNGTAWAALNQPPLVAAILSGNINAAGGSINFGNLRADAGWTIGATNATYTGAPSYVQLTVQIYNEDPQTGLRARVSPGAILRRGAVQLGRAATGYQRHATGHNQSSLTISITDWSPGTNPSYNILSQQDSNQNDVCNIDQGTFTGVAVL